MCKSGLWRLMVSLRHPFRCYNFIRDEELIVIPGEVAQHLYKVRYLFQHLNCHFRSINWKRGTTKSKQLFKFTSWSYLQKYLANCKKEGKVGCKTEREFQRR